MLTADWPSCADNAEIRRMASEIDTIGYTAIHDFVSPAKLAPVQRLAIEAVEKRNGQYAHFGGTDGLQGTILEELAQSQRFQDLFRSLYEATTGRPGPEVNFYQVFRCLKGKTGQQHSARFHFDSYVLTALLPVALPTKGAPGDLLLFPSCTQHSLVILCQPPGQDLRRQPDISTPAAGRRATAMVRRKVNAAAAGRHLLLLGVPLASCQ